MQYCECVQKYYKPQFHEHLQLLIVLAVRVRSRWPLRCSLLWFFLYLLWWDTSPFLLYSYGWLGVGKLFSICCPQTIFWVSFIWFCFIPKLHSLLLGDVFPGQEIRLSGAKFFVRCFEYGLSIYGSFVFEFSNDSHKIPKDISYLGFCFLLRCWRLKLLDHFIYFCMKFSDLFFAVDKGIPGIISSEWIRCMQVE